MREKGKYAVIGTLAGLANGLFGSGGGLFLVPLLGGWAGLEEKRSFATSVAIVFLLSPAALLVSAFSGSLSLQGVTPYLIGGALGGLVSGILFRNISATLLHRLFGVLLLYGGIKAVLLL